MEEADSRTVSSVVYGCLFTLFLSTTFCVRPNVPHPNASTLQTFLSKLNIMAWMLITPELIVAWASYQWFYVYAHHLKQFQKRGWGPAHCQFLLMGGFLLYKDGNPFQSISPELFRSLLVSGCIDFPLVSEDVIQQRSKFRPLLAGVVFLQVTWFVTQFVARLAQHLVITQLEVVTFAFLVLNSLLLLFWWHKPLDARHPIRVDLLRPMPPFPPHTPRDGADPVIHLDFSREIDLQEGLKSIFDTDSHPTTTYESRLPSSIFLRLQAFSIRVLRQYMQLLVKYDAHVPEGTLEVPLFYAPDPAFITPFVFLCANFLGSMFGAAHASVWLAHFPTHRDAVVWKASTLITVIYPITLIFLVFIITVLYRRIFRRMLPLTPTRVERSITISLMAFALLVIVAARTALLIEAFRCLGSLPRGARQSIPWTNYIPHLS